MFQSLESYSLGDASLVEISRHTGSGLRHAHLSTNNPPAGLRNPAAMLVVPTPAIDNSGATHALEHMVLCGSQKFPWRDAFFRMERRSVALHLNAVTNEWLSTFHFTTPSRADFRNLVEFFIDGVFNPLLTDETFAREVVRPQVRTEGSFTGVVYNEMKALTAMPGLALDLAARTRLYPVSPFSCLSGGDPTVIATLKPTQVRMFHRHHYDQASAWILSSGEIDRSECERILDELLPTCQSSAKTADISHNSVVAPPVESESKHQDVELLHLPGGFDATVLCWDRGWSADEFKLLESYLLLDLLISRPDSLLRQSQNSNVIAAAHLNVVDSQASRIAMRLGVGRKTGSATPLPDHQYLLEQISAQRPTRKHLNQALDRLELQYRSDDLRGLGVNSIGRLRHVGEVLCAAVSDSQRRRWFGQSDPMRLLRDRFNSPAACQEAFQRLIDPGTAICLQISGQKKMSESSKVETALPDLVVADASGPEQSPSNRRRPMPIVDIASVPVFPTDAGLVRTDSGSDGPGLFWVPEQAADDRRVKLTAYFQLDAETNANVSQIVCRLDYEANRGVLCELVSTRFEMDSWASSGMGGISVSFTGLSRNVDELLQAFQALVALKLAPDQVPAAALFETVNRTRSTRLESMLRTGHVSAVSAALRQTPGFRLRHHGSGLGLLSHVRQQSWTPLSGRLADRLRHVVVDASHPNRARFEESLGELSTSFTGLAAGELAEKTVATEIDSENLFQRSLIRIPGSVNYLARVLLQKSVEPFINVTAKRLVLAAALRNLHLLEAVRGSGGAYGTGVEVVSEAFALWSYRDPRLRATYDDFAIALAKLASTSLDADQLLEAKLCALTQLNRRFLPESRNASAMLTLIEEYGAGRDMPALYTAVETLGAVDIRACASELSPIGPVDAALVGERWQGDDDKEFEGFDFRDQSLVRSLTHLRYPY